MASILVSDPLSEAGLDILRGAGHEVSYRPGLKGPELLAALREAEALVVRSGTRVTAELIAAAPALRIIGRAGVGVDNIDVEAAAGRGIQVITAAEGSTVTVAEHTLALILALARKIPWAHASLSGGRWERGAFPGVELAGKALGIIGLGRIGRAVAKRAAAFEMKVLGYDAKPPGRQAEESAIERATFEDLLERADVITVHVPLTALTRGMLGAAALARTRHGVLVVNTARGGIVDETALLEALESGRVAGAALDVFENEPPTGSPLLGHPRVLVTPHLGAATSEAQGRVSALIAEKVVAALSSGGA